MTDTERGPTTPYLSDFGWVFLRHIDWPELKEGEPSERTKRLAKKLVHARWSQGYKIHGWTVTF